jgi:hypothetical protein
MKNRFQALAFNFNMYYYIMEMSTASPDHCFLAGLDYELICGCWARQSIAGGFAFRGDSRWLGLARAEGLLGGGGVGRDIVAGWCESGNLFAARVERVAGGDGGDGDGGGDGGGGDGDGGGDGEAPKTRMHLLRS